MGVASFPTISSPFRFDEPNSRRRIELMLMMVTNNDFSDPHRAKKWVEDGDHQRCVDHFAKNPDGYIWMKDENLRALAAEIGIEDKRTGVIIKH